MGTITNPLNTLKVTILQALLTPLTNIQAAIASIEANPNPANAANQFAVIEAQVLTVQLELPALVPTLESEGIAVAAQYAGEGLGQIIADVQAQIAAASATSSAGGSSAPVAPVVPVVGSTKEESAAE